MADNNGDHGVANGQGPFSGPPDPIQQTASTGLVQVSTGSDRPTSPIDEDGNKELDEPVPVSTKKEGSTFLRFLLGSSSMSRALEGILVAAVLYGLSLLCVPHKKASFAGESTRWPYNETYRLAAVTAAGSSFVLIILHFTLKVINQFEGSTILLYLEELERYIAMIIWVTAEFILSWYPELEICRFVIHDAGAEIPKGPDSYELVQATDLLPTARSIFICLAGTLSMLAMKKWWMRNLGMSFNYANYMERIQECLWAERILQTLIKLRATARRTQRVHAFLRKTTPLGHQATVMSEQSVTADPLGSGSHEAVAHKGPLATDPSASALPQAPKPIDKESSQKQDFDAFLLLAAKTLAHLDSSVSISDYRVETAKEAKRLSSKLYQWLRPSYRDYLVENDFKSMFDDADTKKLVGLLNRRSGDIVAISEADFRRVIDGILQDRYGLARSMQSIETALGRIDGIFSFAVVFSATILLALLFTGFGESLTSLTAFISALSFVFASSAGQLFESIVFLLIIHPFDVGDRVYISLSTGSIPPFGEQGMDNLVVSSMYVLSTEFERWDGVKVYVPNYVLANRPIFNVRRSGPINDFLRVQVDYNTPMDRIAEFRKRLESFCKKESADFTGYCRVNVEYMENCNRLGLFVVVQHRTNWQDYDLQLSRRTKVLTFVKSALDELVIGYLPPLQRVAMVTNKSPNL